MSESVYGKGSHSLENKENVFSQHLLPQQGGRKRDVPMATRSATVTVNAETNGVVTTNKVPTTCAEFLHMKCKGHKQSFKVEDKEGGKVTLKGEGRPASDAPADIADFLRKQGNTADAVGAKDKADIIGDNGKVTRTGSASSNGENAATFVEYILAK